MLFPGGSEAVVVNSYRVIEMSGVLQFEDSAVEVRLSGLVIFL